MAEYSSAVVQTVNPNQTVIFTESPVPCTRGFVRHRDESGNFLLSGYVPMKSCGCRAQSALYRINFGGNIAVPTGQTIPAEGISLAITIDGSIIPASTMIYTPNAVEEFGNVSREINAQIWRGCCESVAIVNTSDIPILVSEANIIFSRPDMDVTY